jgi:hypothetical protein
MTEVTVTKVCTQCEAEKPATSEFFSPDPRTKSGFQATCKICRNGLRRAPEMPVQPLRENFEDESAYAEAYQWYLLRLDQKAADDVLADKHAIFSKRESAKRSLKKIAEQQRKLRPGSILPGSLPAGQKDTADIDTSCSGASEMSEKPDSPYIPYAEREPFEGFRKRHPTTLEPPPNDFNSWKSFCAFMDGLSADSKLNRENPKLHAEQKKTEAGRLRRDEADRVRRQYPPFVARTDPEKVIAPVVAVAPEPAAPPRRDVVYQLLLDSFQFYEDGVPVPAGTNMTAVRIFRCGTPPGYRPGDFRIPDGVRLNIFDMVWEPR